MSYFDMKKIYTSTVPVETTISRIEMLLAKVGATAIAKEYVDEQVASLSFVLPLPDGKRVPIRLPANPDKVGQAMLASYKRTPSKASGKMIARQAPRTAWKLMQDWVEVQLSLIQMEQAEPLQVFMPYICSGKETLYEKLKAGNYLALEGL